MIDILCISLLDYKKYNMMEFTSGFGRRVWQNVLLVVEMTCAMCRNRVSNHIFVGEEVPFISPSIQIN